jgi:hypothetical protein
MRLCPRGRDARGVSMDLDFTVIFGSNAAMVLDASAGGGGGRRVEVDGLDNLEAFKEVVDRLMFEHDAMRCHGQLLCSRSDASLLFPFPSGFFCLFVLFDS